MEAQELHTSKLNLSPGVQTQAASGGNVAPVINLLHPTPLGGEPVTQAAAAALPVTAPVAHESSRRALLLIVGIVVLLAAAAATATIMSRVPKQSLSQAPRALSPTPSPSPSASPTPSAMPTPAPTVPPAQSTVSAPVAAPTADHPQMVAVQSKSGLWLRSSPDSRNHSNVIGWIPYHGQVSVDSAGSFWWHGNYAGKTGYFAVNYTH